MKTATMLLLPLVVVSGCVFADQEVDREQVARIYQKQMHFVAQNCDKLSSHEQDSFLRNEKVQDLKLSEVVAALNSKVDGKDIFSIARAKECDDCIRLAEAAEGITGLFTTAIDLYEIGDLTVVEFYNKTREDSSFKNQVDIIEKIISNKD